MAGGRNTWFQEYCFVGDKTFKSPYKSWAKPRWDDGRGEEPQEWLGWRHSGTDRECCFHRNWGASLKDFYWRKLWEIPGAKWAQRGNDREANFSFLRERAFQQLELPKEGMGQCKQQWAPCISELFKERPHIDLLGSLEKELYCKPLLVGLKMVTLASKTIFERSPPLIEVSLGYYCGVPKYFTYVQISPLMIFWILLLFKTINLQLGKNKNKNSYLFCCMGLSCSIWDL